jgi:hypothetical protein
MFNNILIIILFTIIIVSLLHQTEGFNTKSDIYTNNAIDNAKIKGFETGFSGSGSDITNDITRLDYKFATTNADLINLTKYMPYTKNNEENLDIEYHDDPSNISSGGYNLDMGTVMVFDPSLNKIIMIPREENEVYTTYNPPNTFKYGSQNYVPDYTESVKLKVITPNPRAHQTYNQWMGEDYITEIEIFKKALEIIHSGYDKLQYILDTMKINLKLFCIQNPDECSNE